MDRVTVRVFKTERTATFSARILVQKCWCLFAIHITWFLSPCFYGIHCLPAVAAVVTFVLIPSLVDPLGQYFVIDQH